MSLRFDEHVEYISFLINICKAWNFVNYMILQCSLLCDQFFLCRCNVLSVCRCCRMVISGKAETVSTALRRIARVPIDVHVQ